MRAITIACSFLHQAVMVFVVSESGQRPQELKHGVRSCLLKGAAVETCLKHLVTHGAEANAPQEYRYKHGGRWRSFSDHDLLQEIWRLCVSVKKGLALHGYNFVYAQSTYKKRASGGSKTEAFSVDLTLQRADKLMWVEVKFADAESCASGCASAALETFRKAMAEPQRWYLDKNLSGKVLEPPSETGTLLCCRSGWQLSLPSGSCHGEVGQTQVRGRPARCRWPGKQQRTTNKRRETKTLVKKGPTLLKPRSLALSPFGVRRRQRGSGFF